MMRRILGVLVLGAILPTAPLGAAEPIRVAATIFPVADLVRSVGGDHVTVSVLLPPGASPHTFDPTPGQVQEVARARVFFEIGAGLELWADPLARAAGNRDLVVVRLSEGLPLLSTPTIDTTDPGHAHGGANPHVWLDPLYAARMVSRIAEILAGVDPEHRADYFRSALSYTGQLLDLHDEIARTVDSFPQKKYVSFHASWVYFARRYGLEEAGIIEESPGHEPTPKHLQKIIAAVREAGIPAVFAEPQLNPKSAEVIAAEAGVGVALLDPLGGEGVEGRDSYLALLRYNLAEMKRTLGPASREKVR